METLATIRRGLSLSMPTVAKALGVSRQAIYRAEAGLLPAVDRQLRSYYKKLIRKRAKVVEKGAWVRLQFVTRADGNIVLQHKSDRPFVATIRVIDALMAGFAAGEATTSKTDL
jgi:DNA-binding XRE family transcriptional regulator